MEILYMSSLCTIKEYKRMFEKYGTTSSHASQKFHRLMTRGLKANGIDVVMLSYRAISTPEKDDLKHADEQEGQMNFHYLPHCRNRKVNRLYTILQTYSFLKKWKKEHPDMVLISDTINGEFSIAISLFKILHKCKAIGLVLDVPSIRANEHRTGLKAIPIKIKNGLIANFDAYVFLTEQMNNVLNPDQKPYTVIEGLVDENLLNQENSLALKDPKKVIMMAGLLEKEFGVDSLLEAFSNTNDKDIELHLYGKGGSAETVRKFEKKDSRIKFYGEVENSIIMEEEKKATLLINPRPAVGEWTAYSFPSKNMEYMSSGTPLVAYDLPCIPRAYKDYFYEITEMQETIDRLIRLDRQTIHNFGLSAQKWIIENKNPYAQTKELVKIIYELNGGN